MTKDDEAKNYYSPNDIIQILNNINQMQRLNNWKNILVDEPYIEKPYYLDDEFDFLNQTAIHLSSSTNKKIEDLRTEINEKEKQNIDLLNEVQRLNSENQDISKQFAEIRENIIFIEKKARLLNLTSKIHPQAADIILVEDNSILLNHFYSKYETQNAIMSIDIRRSTELMLNAKSSDDFAVFITGLCEGLKQIVIQNYGVFDKFTGDGILAYFPVFYSGEKAVHNCCVAAQLCHNFFSEYYKKHRNKFKIALKTGLGIGIDFGAAKLVRINSEPTIVGVPVVYACRLANIPLNQTFLNQSVYECLKSEDIKITEIDIDIKNQGPVTVYDLINIENLETIPPDWFKDIPDKEQIS